MAYQVQRLAEGSKFGQEHSTRRVLHQQLTEPDSTCIEITWEFRWYSLGEFSSVRVEVDMEYWFRSVDITELDMYGHVECDADIPRRLNCWAKDDMRKMSFMATFEETYHSHATLFCKCLVRSMPDTT